MFTLLISSHFTFKMAAYQTFESSQTFFPHPSDVGYLLGSNGSTLKRISQQTGAEIEFVPYNSIVDANCPVHFVIFGTQCQVAQTLHTFQEMCRKNQLRLCAQSEKKAAIEKTIIMDREDMAMVLGKRGATIKMINMKYGIRSRTTNGNPGDSKSQISLSGYFKNVQAAEQHIYNIIDESRKRRGLAPFHQQTRDIQAENAHMVSFLKAKEQEAADAAATPRTVVENEKEEGEVTDSDDDSDDEEIEVISPRIQCERENKKVVELLRKHNVWFPSIEAVMNTNRVFGGKKSEETSFEYALIDFYENMNDAIWNTSANTTDDLVRSFAFGNSGNTPLCFFTTDNQGKLWLFQVRHQ